MGHIRKGGRVLVNDGTRSKPNWRPGVVTAEHDFSGLPGYGEKHERWYDVLIDGMLIPRRYRHNFMHIDDPYMREQLGVPQE